MTKIKICGLFRECDIDAVNLYRPDWAGFIINFPKSHRSLLPDALRQLRARLDPAIPAVGVFVDQSPELVAGLLNNGTIDIAQLHGHEDETFISSLRGLAPGKEIWQAFRLSAAGDIEAARRSSADMLVLDSGYGSGKAFDWALLEDFDRPYILAGGLTPETIPGAINRLHPYALDISSGVETDKLKDPEKMRAAIEAARNS